jgi:hypothetical protein
VPSSAAAHAAIALVSATVMLYQIAATRLLSVVLWYHFAFLSISLAMLGLGASGVWFSRRVPGARTLPRLLLCAAVTLPCSVWVILQTRLQLEAATWWLGLVAVSMLVPMYCLGAVVCLLLVGARGAAVASLYAADLLGATAGAALIVPLLSSIPTPQLTAALGALPLVALAAHSAAVRGAKQPVPGVEQPHGSLLDHWMLPFVCAAVLVGVVLWGGPFRVRYSKLYTEHGEKAPLHEVWTATARITVFGRPIFSPDPNVPWGWGYGARFRPKPWRERWIDQDGSAGTPVEHLPGAPSELTHLGFDVTSAGYQVFAPKHVCIVGAGGGRDIVTALAFGAQQVDAVEVNRGIYRLMTGPLAALAGNIYTRPGVNTVVDEGRSYLSHTDKRYDAIQISLVDSWAATAAGAFALSENFLYTREALQLYMSRLEPDGVLSISRWTSRVQPFETARLALLAEAALRGMGVADPKAHMLLLTGSAIGTLLVSKQPVTAETLRRADKLAAARGFERGFPTPPGAAGASLVSLALADQGALLEQTGLDLSPPTDDRPFFFQARRLFDFAEQVSQAAPKDVNLQAVSMLRSLVLWLLGLTAALFFAPFVWFGRPQRAAAFWSGSGYFAAIGAGFMLLELSWLQHSVLFLGHPSTATAVVLGSLLAGSGVGAALAGRARVSLWLLPAAALVISLGLGPLFRALLGQALALRCLVAGGVFAGAGVLLGVALPTGLMRFPAEQRAWFWAVNGAFGVLASALSIALAMTLGLRNTALLGAAAYAVAALCFQRAARSP